MVIERKTGTAKTYRLGAGDVRDAASTAAS